MTKKTRSDADSKLAPPLVELMKMLFDVETYRYTLLSFSLLTFFSLGNCMCERPDLVVCRAAMVEFEINMSEMPLGKLSKNNIQKGSYLLKILFICFLILKQIYF